ncbi:MAG: DUF4262 domain-containing protein [Ktedonobacteraceae bacterium]|nr:DUF4262 domain-containing protein [Ktedonobacteraceae bacterium]
MKHHRHVSMTTLQREIREGIALQGFAIRHVSTSNTEPEFTYTVGLHLPGSSRPELFMSGLSREIRVQWMLHLGFLIQGPPPEKARKQMTNVQGVSAEASAYPEGGRVFQPGVRYLDLTGNGLPTCLGEVDQHYYEDYFGQALVFHSPSAFPVLQIVWPDTRGRFPFEASFERRFLKMQHLLFDPQRYLPLREAELEQ